MKKAIAIITVLAFALASCATQQGPTRDRDAWKRNKEKQREVRAQFGHR
jgi:PBP1b-binding outer membrane lipoprotein LpoB